jgi:hypothetical protein
MIIKQSTFRFGENDLCTCGTAPMTAEICCKTVQHTVMKKIEIWEQPVTLQEQLYGNALNLELTTAFFQFINVSV